MDSKKTQMDSKKTQKRKLEQVSKETRSKLGNAYW